MKKFRIVRELAEFLISQKKYWIAPIIIVLILLGVILVLAKGSAVAPLIYTLF